MGVYGENACITDRTGETIDVARSIDEAVEDLEAAIAFGRSLPFVKPGPV